MRKLRAFTLVELLVVIAVIGIMAGLVVVIFNTVRSKGKDSQIKSDISQLAIDADIWGTKHNNNWTGWCSQTAGSNFLNLSDSIATNNGGTAPSCNGTATSWIVVAVMTSGNTNICTDSTGKTTTSEFTTDYNGEAHGGYYVGATTCVGTPI